MEANYLHKMRSGQSSDVAKVKSEVTSEAPQGDRTLVKTHVKSIYRKTGAASRDAAVTVARGHGLL